MPGMPDERTPEPGQRAQLVVLVAHTLSGQAAIAAVGIGSGAVPLKAWTP
jgi:hypothetical protein